VLRVGFAGVAVLALALLPKACAKKPPPDPPIDAPLPPPIPVTSATTPPIWSPPTGPATAVPTTSTAPPPPPSPELVKARAASDARDFKKVKTLLDKKVRGGKCAPEESQLLFRACVQLKDKACADAVKAKHPDDVASE
jgi:hypothetical protein